MDVSLIIPRAVHPNQTLRLLEQGVLMPVIPDQWPQAAIMDIMIG